MPPFVVNFGRVDSESKLARCIGCDDGLIREVIEFNRAPQEENETDDHGMLSLSPFGLHRTFRIPKKNRRRTHEYRTVTEVKDRRLVAALKSLTRRLDGYLREGGIGYPSSSCLGFVSGGSTYKNAKPHLGARFLVTADIEDFFPSIGTGRVEDALVAASVPREGARLIAEFTTVRGELPLGFSTSPLLSNLVCLPLDGRFEALSKRLGAAYSRYADDLAFSSDDRTPSLDEVQAVLHEEGFCLAERKYRKSTRGQHQVVTGLSIADPERPRLPRAFKRKLRQELHMCERHTIKEHAEAIDVSVERAVNAIDGRIGYVQGIEPELGEELRARWRRILARDGIKATYPTRFPSWRGSGDKQLAAQAIAGGDYALVVVDEARWSLVGQDYFALAAVIVDDPPVTRSVIAALAKARSEDPFYGGRAKQFEKKGFHYSDDPERARDEVCRMLSSLPLRANVTFGQYRANLSFAENYLRMFRWLMARRMGAADWRPMVVSCDSHQQVGQDALESVVRERYQQLSVRHGRQPVVRSRRKTEEPLLMIPDYLLAVAGAYLASGSSSMDKMQVRRFEQLRDKYRLIRDFDRHRSYNRRRIIDPHRVLHE